jgi:hypothetical protein
MPLRRRPSLPAAALAFAALLLPWAGLVQAQTPGQTQNEAGIFTCTDARGRTLTADRPIADCIDRTQRELGPSGTVRRTLEPTYTSQEQAERDERARQSVLKASRVFEERRRERALLARYPSAVSHDRERAAALLQIDAVMEVTRSRIAELTAERQPLNDELEFYRKDVNRAPSALRRKLDDNTHSMQVQNEFLAAREEEKRRVNMRFDEERGRLLPYWTPAATSAR